MIKEIVKLNLDILNMNVDIFNYATRQFANYLTVAENDVRDIVAETRNQSSVERIFNGFLADLQNALRRPVISEQEIDSSAQLFEEEYASVLKENRRTGTLPFLEINDPFSYGYAQSNPLSLRERKVIDLFNDMRYDIRDRDTESGRYYSSAERPQRTRPYPVDESKINRATNSFINSVKELYGIKLNTPAPVITTNL